MTKTPATSPVPPHPVQLRNPPPSNPRPAAAVHPVIGPNAPARAVAHAPNGPNVPPAKRNQPRKLAKPAPNVPLVKSGPRVLTAPLEKNDRLAPNALLVRIDPPAKIARLGKNDPQPQSDPLGKTALPAKSGPRVRTGHVVSPVLRAPNVLPLRQLRLPWLRPSPPAMMTGPIFWTPPFPCPNASPKRQRNPQPMTMKGTTPKRASQAAAVPAVAVVVKPRQVCLLSPQPMTRLWQSMMKTKTMPICKPPKSVPRMMSP